MRRFGRRGRYVAGLVIGSAAALTFGALAPLPAAAGGAQPAHGRARALLVCNGTTQRCPRARHYGTVQAAVDAARPGDWVLIWPGVYHEKNAAWAAGVWISTPGLHIRGLDRNRVIIDGSDGPSGRPCPSDPALQDYTPRDGIVVWQASGVSIQNLTVCDYLSGASGHGNEIWWNGGSGSGKIGMGAYYGSYLTATSMYGPDIHQVPNAPLAQYGIFVSNARGPGLIAASYASNMADAAYYVGACQRTCDTVLAFDRGTNSALGYSGTNAGGRLIITRSVFDHNRAGIAPNSLNNDDAPPPQDGRCPGSQTRSCMVIEHNYIADNNNANAPTSGLMPAVGAGIEISGGSYDTVRANVIVRQGSWGIVTHDYPDPETPPPGSDCQGGFPGVPLSGWCLFPARGSLVYGNRFTGDGFFGNATNGDLATEALIPQSPAPRNCFFRNTDTSGTLTSTPAGIEDAAVDGPPCGAAGTVNDQALFDQLICATGFLTCPDPSAHYPQQTAITIAPLPRLPNMPDPCRGVPRNAYCRSLS
ncbi:MAG TPA: hypothetical protein VKD26_02240 [Streptosporangiaceae bacterium]|nr:hypothetical protein [Streptosporangiaceae bacterium]